MELLRPEPAPPVLVSLGAQARSPVTMKPAEAQSRAEEQPEPQVAQSPTLPKASPLASPQAAQPLQASQPEHAQRAALSHAAPPAPQPPCAG